jgi:hypothetical protein
MAADSSSTEGTGIEGDQLDNYINDDDDDEFEVDVDEFEVDVDEFEVDVDEFEVDADEFEVDVDEFEVDVEQENSLEGQVESEGYDIAVVR